MDTVEYCREVKRYMESMNPEESEKIWKNSKLRKLLILNGTLTEDD